MLLRRTAFSAVNETSMVDKCFIGFLCFRCMRIFCLIAGDHWGYMSEKYSFVKKCIFGCKFRVHEWKHIPSLFFIFTVRLKIYLYQSFIIHIKHHYWVKTTATCRARIRKWCVKNCYNVRSNMCFWFLWIIWYSWITNKNPKNQQILSGENLSR